MKKILVILFCVSLVGCQYRQKENEVSFKNENGTIIVLSKVCLDGVVYLYGSNVLAPKLNQEGKVEVCEKSQVK